MWITKVNLDGHFDSCLEMLKQFTLPVEMILFFIRHVLKFSFGGEKKICRIVTLRHTGWTSTAIRNWSCWTWKIKSIVTILYLYFMYSVQKNSLEQASQTQMSSWVTFWGGPHKAKNNVYPRTAFCICINQIKASHLVILYITEGPPTMAVWDPWQRGS